MNTTPILDVRNLSLAFGGLKAVNDFNLTLFAGDLHGLIGPNGAGKTTVFNLLTGMYQPDVGTIDLAGKRLKLQIKPAGVYPRGVIGLAMRVAASYSNAWRGAGPWTITKAGIARTFQNIRLFSDLSVLDNVLVACHLRARHTLWHTLLRSPRYLRDEAEMTAHARSLLEAMDLGERADDLARNLPYGDQRRLEIARALATGPKVLLLDEPAAGMNPSEKRALTGLIRNIRQRFKLTILLIEHDMGLVMDVCERITVLDHGQTIACGTPHDVQNDEEVIKAYLGEPVKDNRG